MKRDYREGWKLLVAELTGALDVLDLRWENTSNGGVRSECPVCGSSAANPRPLLITKTASHFCDNGCRVGDALWDASLEARKASR